MSEETQTESSFPSERDPQEPELQPEPEPGPAPSLLEDLDELQSPTSVKELEAASAEAKVVIADAVAEAAVANPSVPPLVAEPYIAFDKVSIAFGDRKILDNISFHVGRGQTLCILGRSGVGKSVSLRILLGFLAADSGCIRVDGKEITTMHEAGLQEIRKQVTMVFQNGALFDSLSVGENIAFPLREKGGLAEDQIQQLVMRLLELVGASETIDLLPSSLSTGQKRCIAIARGLAAQPQAILYDEPTTMVDPIMGRLIGDLIQRLKLQLGITSIVVTHDMRFAMRLADLVLFLDSGTARFFGTIHEFQQCTDPHVLQFLTLDAYQLPVANGSKR
ncbi:ABC transporter ATP-binding protein [Acidicapsa ligni]|uniref:ABC transporter ATP-binding protein n=1 Tax=Acidicapsa ligni TaxID=542300 RepID=UPI0021DFF56A|nr:ATP-binding cassette domain-containing protein [Acidicapsa ligni]